MKDTNTLPSDQEAAARPALDVVAEGWARWATELESIVTARGFETIDELRASIESGAYYLVPGENCCAVAGHTLFRGAKWLTVIYLCGSPSSFSTELEPNLREYAANNGYAGIIAHCAPSEAASWESAAYQPVVMTLRRQLRS